jgi:predicted anti-sigma-YlaC factor YlaD
MTCRDAAALIASGALDGAPPATCVAVTEHMSRCPPCRAFDRQLTVVVAAARRAAARWDAEAPADLEARLKHGLDLWR